MTTPEPDAAHVHATAGAMSPVRSRYLAAARTAVDLVCSREVERAWDRASVLAELSVGQLAAHLARSVVLVRDYLHLPDPADPAPLDAAAYFAVLTGTTDLASPVNVGIRERARDDAADGRAALAERVHAALDDVTDGLGREPVDRQVTARGVHLVLDEYLRTRLVEIVLHVEDLELSVGLGPGLTADDDVPNLPEDAVADAVDVLVATARNRHGDAAVLRALARRERDRVQALRVF